jgi:L-lactate dehydrogenase complex protein LldG
MSGREEMLAGLRRALQRDGTDRAHTVAERLAHPPRHLLPARADVPQPARVDLFCQWAEAVNATVARLASHEVPAAVAAYLAGNNLPSQLVAAPGPQVAAFDWGSQPLLELRYGTPVDADRVALTGAFAGVAETGTLVMTSGPEHPTSLNLLPETHIVILREADIVGTYEDVWARLRERFGAGQMPRAVNTITGPSRTADIEQTIQLGAHGPRRMHILIVRA